MTNGYFLRVNIFLKFDWKIVSNFVFTLRRYVYSFMSKSISENMRRLKICCEEYGFDSTDYELRAGYEQVTHNWL